MRELKAIERAAKPVDPLRQADRSAARHDADLERHTVESGGIEVVGRG